MHISVLIFPIIQSNENLLAIVATISLAIFLINHFSYFSSQNAKYSLMSASQM